MTSPRPARIRLQESLARATGATGLDNNVGVRLRELERINAANKTLFEDFLSRAKLTQEQSSFEERESRLISPATKPTAPSFPKKGLVEALAGVVGLLLGIGGGVALDMLNAGFTTAREIEDKLNLPVLAAIPILSDADRKVQDRVLDPPRYPRRQAAVALRRGDPRHTRRRQNGRRRQSRQDHSR